jgi:MFS family permease
MFATVSFCYGVASTNWTVANSRLMMATMPAMGRNHFFALFIVITNVGWGLAPILWGLLIDLVNGHEFTSGAIAWNRYSIYFASALLLAVVTLIYTHFLHESPQESETVALAVEQRS